MDRKEDCFMSPDQFVYWLQGFMEMQEPVTLDARQTQMIKDHLALVFEKVTKSFSPPPPAKTIDDVSVVGPKDQQVAPDLNQGTKHEIKRPFRRHNSPTVFC